MDFELTNGAYSVYGRGDPDFAEATVLLLHYFGGSGRTFYEVMDALPANLHSLAPDLRGFGHSLSRSPDYSVESYADDLSELVAALKLTRYVVVGHSMGGKFALALAARQPAGLTGVVLLAPSPPTPEPMADAERQRLLTSHGSPEAALETLGKTTARPLPPLLQERAIEDNVRSQADAWQAWLNIGSRENIAARLAAIRVPVVVLVGAADKGLTAPLLQKEIVERIEGARLEIVPDCGHLLPLEVPQAVANFISRAISL